MNHKRLLAMLATLLVVAVMACRNSEEKVSNGAAGTTDTSTTSTSGTDTSGTATTSIAASATTRGFTGGTVSNLSAEDKDFVMKAAIGGLAEVQMGQTAQQKGQNADVKAFGARMVTDHSKTNDELKQLATTKGLALPTDLDEKHKKTADSIAVKNGKDFDKAYMSDMVKDHEEDVKEFEKTSKTAGEADIRSWAAKTLPTLQEHLRMAKETLKKVK
jgi:putative membrane protein